MSLYPKEIFAEKAALVLELAKRHGADEASVSVSQSEGISVETRAGKLEELNREQELSISIGVYKNQAAGSSSLSDWSADALEKGVQAAVNAAKYTEADPNFGLPEPALYAQELDTEFLQLDSGELPDAAWLEEQTQRMETAAFAADGRIAMSDGASGQSSRSYHYYATSNGFAAGAARSRCDLSIALLAKDGDDQQSNYAYGSARWKDDLPAAESIGEEAARRTAAMLKPQTAKTGSCPVLFAPEMARSLFGHLTGALAGSAQYRKLSYLNGALGQTVLPEWLNLIENPHIVRGLYSGLCDGDGLPAAKGALIERGVVQHYLLNVYGARRLGLAPTGNAGGVRNLTVEADAAHTKTPDELLKHMHTGVLITSLMGQGVNPLTGDYSRGASGFWVENGEIAYPIDGITIAGNLKTLLPAIAVIGNDPDPRSMIRSPSVLIESMTVAR